MRLTQLREQDGFTLIELLIVMIILGLLAALVGPRMFGKVGSSRQKAAKAQISLLETALDTYRLDTGTYPSTEQGLQALRTKPDGVKNWDGPYLPKDVPKDPWGHPYIYKCPGEHGDYDIISYGADGVEGGEGENADIVNWEDNKGK
ncbi:MAG: type II secretion system major pseudopilin GspG [Deltaproteobacteria bacterium]|nr:type II secretion system major pseudopilin GspG [Deltaproteobacteria bacterium]